MTRQKIKEKDLGWKKIKRELLGSENMNVVVGILGKDAQRKESQPYTNVQIGAVHEFGSKKRNIHQRSFLRSTLAENQDRYEGAFKKLLMAVVQKRSTVSGAFRFLGSVIVGDVIRKINKGIQPGLKKATIKAKKSSKPLIDTGQLKQSITYEVRHE